MHSSLRLRWTMTGTYSRSHLPAMPPSGICWWLTKRWSPGASGSGQLLGGKAGNAVRAGGRQIGDAVKFPNTLRAKLMKRGGVGYAQPGPDTFPSLDEVNRLIVACGALPCATWLDGTSAGEQAEEELLELLIGKGTVVLNIVPDRNWNLPDPEKRRMMVQKLYEVVALCAKLDLPLNIGTEMNAPVRNWLMISMPPSWLLCARPSWTAQISFTAIPFLQRALSLGYQSEWARTHFPARRERNAFYTQAGRLVTPGRPGMTRMKLLSPELSPAALMDRLAHPA